MGTPIPLFKQWTDDGQWSLGATLPNMTALYSGNTFQLREQSPFLPYLWVPLVLELMLGNTCIFSDLSQPVSLEQREWERLLIQWNNTILLLLVFVEKCPVYPTELVFALDQSYDITEQRFNETRDIITSIVNDLHIWENNCPVGARVVVVSYNSGTSYLIRGSDYRNKKQLLQLLSQIKYQNSGEVRDMGNAMRFVARNIFKRTFSGPNVRRVAVFFSNGQATSSSSIITATMEFSALDISPAVFAYNERVFLDEAFGVSSSLGNIFILKVVLVLTKWGSYE